MKFNRSDTVKILLLTTSFFIVGCSAILPSVKSDGSAPYGNERCANPSEQTPAQNAPDDCKKEICVNGSLVSIEDLTETAPVSDWAEEKYCFSHPSNCLGALSVKDRELQWEHDMASDGFWERKSGYNGLGDAARHVYLGCMLTERFGGKFAQGLLGAHEEDSSATFGFGKSRAGNKCCEKIMDSHNHQIGIDLAGEQGNCEKKVLNALNKTRHSLCEESK